MSTVSDESIPDYQSITLEVQCSTYLIEKSEELKTIFRSAGSSGKLASGHGYFIRIVQVESDSHFEGCFVNLQVPKAQKSITEEDTLKAQEGEKLLVGTGLTSPDRPATDSGTSIAVNSTTVTYRYNNNSAPTLAIMSPTGTKIPANPTEQEPINQMVIATSQRLPVDFGDVNNLSINPSSVSSGPKTDGSVLSSGVTEILCESEDDQRNASIQREAELRRRHALYHVLHNKEKCPFYDNTNLCQQNYDDDAAMIFKHYLNGWKISDKGCEECFIDHLASNVCDSSCPLWKFCLTNKISGALKYASKGFVIHSKLRENMIGEICTDYTDYQEKDVIGHGGFGKVYQINEDCAVKEEYKRPLIFLDSGVFQIVVQFNNTIDDHVIPLLEYVVGGPSSEDPKKKRVFLFVMPLMNKGGLNKHFEEHKCILEYMTKFPDQKECIFSNYIVLFLHVFKGLQYLHSRKIVHGDVKDTNILVHQTCSCVSPLQCVCPGGSGVTYVLGDMDLFCVQGETLTGKYLNWAKEKFTEPAGTRGLKPTELYFMGMQGEKCASNKTDVWGGSLTMTKILAGDDAIKSAIKYLNEFFDSISLRSSEHVFNIAKARSIAQELQKDVILFDLSKERPCDIEYLNEKAKSIHDKFKRMSQLLASGKLLKQGRWMFSYTYPEKLPLPLIIGAVHGANVLYEECLDKIPSIFGTPLWETMKKVLKIITACVKFLPDDRPDASQVITDLEKLQK